MKFSNSFKIFWWILLIILFGVALAFRVKAVLEDRVNTIDVILVILFSSLLLLPLLSEIEIFGIKFKQEIEHLKENLGNKIGEVKNEIKSIQIQSVVNNFSSFAPPPPDSKLPELEERINALSKKFEENTTFGFFKEADVPESNIQMFKVRFKLERELRRIWRGRYDQKRYSYSKWNLTTVEILREMLNMELIDSLFYDLLREIFSICNYAIHGDEPSDSQIDFINSHAGEVLRYLHSIK
ncbi:hypothetical protein [Leptospira sp. id769339]|uniref:hypothetical protein n=1 Tax=Leptospira sp. id769339 TaxID=2864221 RepID=UPI00214B567B|nr:hypothetical protein [Leptospira sp. id769339]MCR1795734.1 hypothetical protein [Leptospira sp. id769339]